MQAVTWARKLFKKPESGSKKKLENPKDKSGASGSRTLQKKDKKNKNSTNKDNKNEDELEMESVQAQFFFLQGIGTGRPDSQDTYGLYDKHLEQFSFYAVFDGHGASGKEASNSVCDFMLGYIDKKHKMIAEASEEGIIKTLTDMFMEADKFLLTCGVDMECSGTTCTCIIVRGTTLFVASVGDSRAVLSRVTDNRRFAIELTRDHKPLAKGEKDRIIKNGGELRPVMLNREFHGQYRIWADDEGPGLAVTRSLGDYGAKRIGLIATPEVQMIKMKEYDQFIILATDGIWEVLSSNEAVALVLKLGEDRSMAARQLVVEARSMWMELSRLKQIESKVADLPGRAAVDDISAIILFFKFVGVEQRFKTLRMQEENIGSTDKRSLHDQLITPDYTGQNLKSGTLPMLDELPGNTEELKFDNPSEKGTTRRDPPGISAVDQASDPSIVDQNLGGDKNRLVGEQSRQDETQMETNTNRFEHKTPPNETTANPRSQTNSAHTFRAMDMPKEKGLTTPLTVVNKVVVVPPPSDSMGSDSSNVDDDEERAGGNKQLIPKGDTDFDIMDDSDDLRTINDYFATRERVGVSFKGGLRVNALGESNFTQHFDVSSRNSHGPKGIGKMTLKSKPKQSQLADKMAPPKIRRPGPSAINQQDELEFSDGF